MPNILYRALRFGSHLYALAGTTGERLSLVKFFARYGTAALLPCSTRQEDVELQLHGTRYVFGVNTTEVFSLDELYYHREYDKVQSFIPKAGWVVFDVGANVGVYTNEQARIGARVYAFEPNPHCYRRLRKMLVLNNMLSSVKSFNVALGNAIGDVGLQVAHGQTTSGTINSVAGLGKQDAIVIPVTTLDRIVSSFELPGINLLKIDVEGYEIEVLQGAINSLPQVERIVVEYHTQELYENVLELMVAHGFKQVLHAPKDELLGLGVIYFARMDIPVSC